MGFAVGLVTAPYRRANHAPCPPPQRFVGGGLIGAGSGAVIGAAAAGGHGAALGAAVGGAVGAVTGLITTPPPSVHHASYKSRRYARNSVRGIRQAGGSSAAVASTNPAAAN